MVILLIALKMKERGSYLQFTLSQGWMYLGNTKWNIFMELVPVTAVNCRAFHKHFYKCCYPNGSKNTEFLLEIHCNNVRMKCSCSNDLFKSWVPSQTAGWECLGMDLACTYQSANVYIEWHDIFFFFDCFLV